MKKICILLLCLIVILGGCGTVKNSDVNTSNSLVQNQIDTLEQVNSDFGQIMAIGTDLISELNSMSSSDEYSSLVKADGYVKEMKKYYLDLMNLCDKNEGLEGMAYQLKILDHSCPDPMVGPDATAINNQKILYQLHLKQLSSSFTYLSEYMDYLAEKKSKPAGVAYFTEVPEMPKPDTVMYEITFDSEKTASGVKQYMYLIGDTEEDANMNYSAYIVALGIADGLSVEIANNTVYIYKNGAMVSAMMAGTDPQKGRFMIVSFRE